MEWVQTQELQNGNWNIFLNKVMEKNKKKLNVMRNLLVIYPLKITENYVFLYPSLATYFMTKKISSYLLLLTTLTYYKI